MTMFFKTTFNDYNQLKNLFLETASKKLGEKSANEIAENLRKLYNSKPLHYGLADNQNPSEHQIHQRMKLIHKHLIALGPELNKILEQFAPHHYKYCELIADKAENFDLVLYNTFPELFKQPYQWIVETDEFISNAVKTQNRAIELSERFINIINLFSETYKAPGSAALRIIRSELIIEFNKDPNFNIADWIVKYEASILIEKELYNNIKQAINSLERIDPLYVRDSGLNSIAPAIVRDENNYFKPFTDRKQELQEFYESLNETVKNTKLNKTLLKGDQNIHPEDNQIYRKSNISSSRSRDSLSSPESDNSIYSKNLEISFDKTTEPNTRYEPVEFSLAPELSPEGKVRKVHFNTGSSTKSGKRKYSEMNEEESFVKKYQKADGTNSPGGIGK